MKLIHCADVHLDSKMGRHLDDKKAKMRRDEVLQTFLRMVEYGAEQCVRAILIAGDLFDTARVSVGTLKAVERAMLMHPEMEFYLLRGNHSAAGFLEVLDTIPDNLKLFSSDWTKYQLDEAGRVFLYGAELNSENSGTLFRTLLPDYDRCNLVMLHGQQQNYVSRNKAENIALGELRNKGIDYLALGHVHEYHMEQLDARGTWCYSGCLEGRGFDECGEHGFVLIDIDEGSGQLRYEFVPFATRTLHTVQVDVSDCMNSSEMTDVVRGVLQETGIPSKDMIKVVLTGKLDVMAEVSADFIAGALSEDYYFLKVSDETGIAICYERFYGDESLKGEYVRLIMGDDTLDEETKAALVRYGLLALAGEEII